MNFRIVFKILGILAVLIGITMGACWIFAWWAAEQDGATSLDLSA